MKKVLMLVFAFITILAFSFTPVKADNPNLFNPAPTNYSYGTGSNTITYTLNLLENHSYRFLTNLAGAQSFQDLADNTMQITIQIGSTVLLSFDSELMNFPEQDFSFDVLPGSTVFSFTAITNVDIGSEAYVLDVFFKDIFRLNYITLENTGQVAPIDTVEPEFTYSNIQIDAPYYNVPTIESIQSTLQAMDDQDGDVTDRIMIERDELTSQLISVGGEYYVLFSVEDNAGNKAYLRVDINIIDDIAPDANYNGLLMPNEYTIYISWYNDDVFPQKLTIDDVINLISFSDEIDGTTLDINSVVDYYGEESFQDVIGTHVVTITAEDMSGNGITIFVNIEVIENNPPTISGPSSRTIEITTYNRDHFLALFSASDLEDGAISLEIDTQRSTFHVSNVVLGNFTLIFYTSDSLGRYVEKVVAISVVDTTIPVFKINNIAVTNYSITVPMSNTSVLQALINSIVVTDAYYGTITASKVVPSLPSFALPSTSNLVITATDPSGNTGTLTITVTIQDDILPVINGATKIVKGKTGSLVLSEITAQLSAVDNVSGVLPVELVSDGYTGNGLNVGSYLVRYKATDAAGNIRYHDVRVWVIDNVAPVWIVNDYFINLGMNQSMTRTELIALLQASGMIPGNFSYTVTFIGDEYTGNEATPGTYSVTMKVTFDNGSESNLNVQLSVPQVPDVIIVTPDTPTTGFARFFDGVLSFLSSAWDFSTGVVVSLWDGLSWTWENIVIPVYEWIFVKDTTPFIPPVTTVTTQTPPVTTTTTITPATLPQTTSTITSWNIV
jgi:hypothetical protein